MECYSTQENRQKTFVVRLCVLMRVWVGVCVSCDQRFALIFLMFNSVNKLGVLILKRVSQVVWGFLIKSYKNFKIQNWTKEDRGHIGKLTNSYIDEKRLPNPLQVSQLLQKYSNRINMITILKICWVYLKSRNDKNPLASFMNVFRSI